MPMKPLDFQKNLLATARRLCHPALMISLVLHGVMLMLPISSNLNLQASKSPKQYKQVKLTQLPTTRPSPTSSSPVPSKLNPQPSPQSSQFTPSDLPNPLQSPWQPNFQPSPSLNQSVLPNQPTSSVPITTRQQLPESSAPIRESTTRSPQQPKKEETQQQPLEQPKRSPTPQEPTPVSQPTPKLTQSPQPNLTPTQLPAPTNPTPVSQPTPEPTSKNDATGEGFGGRFANLGSSECLKVALAQVERDNKDQFKKFETDQDLNKLTKASEFKDISGKPDTTKFQFLNKALPPLTQNITSILDKTVKTFSFMGCGFEPKGNYGGGSLYEVTKGDSKSYVILAPGKDEQGDMTAIIVLQNYPS